MAFDGVFTAAVCRELNRRLRDARIDRVYQPSNEELVLFIYTKSGNVRLLLSASSSSARAHLVKGEIENPAEPPGFCMLLRKLLIGGHIIEIIQEEGERILEFRIEVLDELGFKAVKRLVVEIMGKHSNIVLMDEKTGRIADSIKRVSIDVNRPRQILPGLPYEYPPKQEKTPLSEADEGFCRGLLESVTSEPGASRYREELSGAILSRVKGFSPNLADEAAGELLSLMRSEPYRSTGGSAKEAEALSPAKLLSSVFSGMKGREPSGPIYLYFREDGKPLDFHIFRLSALEGASKAYEFSDIHEGLEHYFDKRESSNRVKQASYGMEKSLSSLLDKLSLKKQRMLEDIKRAEEAEKYRIYGELLTANLHLAKPGDSSITVQNYYTGGEITIPLDVKIPAAKNAQAFFKKYAKSRVTIKEKGELLQKTDADIEYLRSVQALLEGARDIRDVEALRAELADGGYIRLGKTAKARRSIKGRKKPQPVEYKTAGGFRVLAGRSNIENDYLTFKLASKTDIWFHTKDIPGSHVILFSGGKTADELPPEDIYEAASIAAYHSKARASENVPVDYTSCRHVKKISGAKPGMVIFTDNRTVYVDPKKED